MPSSCTQTIIHIMLQNCRIALNFDKQPVQSRWLPFRTSRKSTYRLDDLVVRNSAVDDVVLSKELGERNTKWYAVSLGYHVETREEHTRY